MKKLFLAIAKFFTSPASRWAGQGHYRPTTDSQELAVTTKLRAACSSPDAVSSAEDVIVRSRAAGYVTCALPVHMDMSDSKVFPEHPVERYMAAGAFDGLIALAHKYDAALTISAHEYVGRINTGGAGMDAVSYMSVMYATFDFTESYALYVKLCPHLPAQPPRGV